jgi:hypothetical protein
MSAEALRDPSWLRSAESARAERVIPVRLQELTEPAPERLRSINWLVWDAANTTATLASLVSALYADPRLHQRFRQLAHEADAWQQDSRRADLLLEDYGAAQQAHDLLATLAADDQVTPSPVTVEFVEKSLAVARRLRRRRRRRRVAAAVVLVVTAAAISSAISGIKLGAKINRASLVTAGDSAILDQLPEWSAVQAAELLVHGSAQEQELARATLVRALGNPWRLSEFDFIDSGTAAVPFNGGEKTAVLALAHTGSAVAILDNRTGTLLSAFALRGHFRHLDVAPDNASVVLADPGLAVLNVASHVGRVVVGKGTFDVRVLANEEFVTWTSGGFIQLRDRSGKVIRTLPRSHKVVAIETGSAGGAAALIETRKGAYEIVDVVTGKVYARARLPVPAPSGIGDLSPDLRRAVIAAGDGQLWTFGVAEAAAPTGIATPTDVHGVLWRSEGRLIVVSDSQAGQVFALPEGENLGHVCWGLPSVQTLRGDRTANVIACDARAVWMVPRGPIARPMGPLSSKKGARGRYASIDVKGSRYRIRLEGALGSGDTAWTAPLNTTITAAAFDQDGRELVLGGDNSGVAIVGITATGARTTVLWQTPDGSPITAVGWDTRGPLARTAAGNTWRVPTCSGCQTDAGLLATLRSRLTGCLTSRQLAWITSDVRKKLNLHVCRPVTKL